MSRLALVTASTDKLIPLATAKSFCRVDIDDDDAILAILLDAACAYVETFTNRQFLSKTWDLFLDSWDGVLDKHSSFKAFDSYFSIPSEKNAVRIPIFPLQSIDEWEYQDENDATQTFDQGTVTIDTATNTFARATLNPTESWPNLSEKANAIRIRFTAGFLKTCDVPAEIPLAVLQLVAHWYENRESVVVGTSAGTIPLSTQALLWSARMPEV